MSNLKENLKQDDELSLLNLSLSESSGARKMPPKALQERLKQKTERPSASTLAERQENANANRQTVLKAIAQRAVDTRPVIFDPNPRGAAAIQIDETPLSSGTASCVDVNSAPEKLATPFAIRPVTVSDVEQLTPLVDAYRAFYRKSPSADTANFLTARLSKNQCVSLVAYAGADSSAGCFVGFVTMYPSFSTASLDDVWYLADLFVDPAFRRQGVGASLLKAAAAAAKEAGVTRMYLRTEVTNTSAQSLYESLGWVRDTQYYRFDLSLV